MSWEPGLPATVLLRAVRASSQAEPGEQPAAATEPAVAAQPEKAVQLIRVGSGCLACPGERQPTEVQQAPSIPRQGDDSSST